MSFIAFILVIINSSTLLILLRKMVALNITSLRS